MHEYIKTLLSAIKAWVTGELHASIANWNENDPSSLSYIKNRTHWIENKKVKLKGRTTIVDNENVYCQEQNSGYVTFDPFIIDIINQQIYYVTWDGIEYECVAYIATGPNSPSIGNGSIVNVSGGNGEPFFITVYNDSVMFFCTDTYDHTITIETDGESDEEVEVEVIHHLDSKYIKDMYFEDKSNVKEVVPEQEVNGFNNEYNSSFYEVLCPFNFIPSSSSVYTVVFDGIEYICTCYEDYWNNLRCVGNVNYIAYQNEGDIPFAIIISDGTTYLSTTLPGETHTIYIYTGELIINKIAPKYLPNIVKTPSWNNILDKPFEEIDSNVLIDDYTIYFNWYDSSLGRFDLELGETYTVIYDYKAYDVVCYDDNGIKTLANFGEYPFRIYAHEQEVFIDKDSIRANGYNAHITIKKRQIKTLDPKYLPIDCINTNIFDGIILKDSINGYEYIGEMQNGNFVTYCRGLYIEITQLPNKINYDAGDIFDPTGMIVTLKRQDGTSKVIDNYTYNEIIPNLSEPIKISYIEAGKVCSGYVSISVNTIQVEDELIDFEYIDNGDGTYTLTEWKGTYYGEPSSNLVVPDRRIYHIEWEGEE